MLREGRAPPASLPSRASEFERLPATEGTELEWLRCEWRADSPAALSTEVLESRGLWLRGSCSPSGRTASSASTACSTASSELAAAWLLSGVSRKAEAGGGPGEAAGICASAIPIHWRSSENVERTTGTEAAMEAEVEPEAGAGCAESSPGMSHAVRDGS